jgi:hypothetical protein
MFSSACLRKFVCRVFEGVYAPTVLFNVYIFVLSKLYKSVALLTFIRKVRV